MKRPLVPVLVLVAVSVLGQPAGAAVHRPYVVHDVMAGRDRMTPTPPEQGDTTIEPSIAVNPSDPNNAVTVYQEGRVDGGGDQDNGYATTFDGGRTWTYGELPGLTLDVKGPWDRASDAVVAFGPNNVVYANSLVFNDTTNQGLASGIAVNVSTDGGATWGPPVLVDDQQANPLDDKNWIVVDNSNASGHHQGRVYAVWDRVAGVFISYSDDQGKTWTPPLELFSGQGIGAIPLVLPNGDVAVVFDSSTQPGRGDPGVASEVPVEHEAPLEPNPGGTDVVIAVSPGAGSIPTGGPLAFQPPVVINTYQGNPIRQQRAGGLPTADVDQKTGRIYVGWEDGRFRKDQANDAVVTWSLSSDYTKWHALKRVNPGRRKDWVDHYNTMLAVGSDGSLRVGYLVRREAATLNKMSPYVDTYYQQSLDGGKTFSAPLRVNRKHADVRFAAFSRNGAFFGDYNQLAVGGARTYVVTCIAYRVKKNEQATFPPAVHHQRTWVAVVGGG